MTASELALILESPDTITLSQVYELENIIYEFPFFQAARAAHLRVLYTQSSYRYNRALKITASQVGNRTALFNYITSKIFKEARISAIENRPATLKQTSFQEAIPKGFTDYVTEDAFTAKKGNSFDFQRVKDEKPETPTMGSFNFQPKTSQEIEKSLDIGKPIDFKKEDTHSFSQWLELTRNKPLEREPNKNQTLYPLKDNLDSNKTQKFDLIDKFLENEPKFEAKKEFLSEIDLTENQGKNQSFMTETLAKVYLEQKKYEQAIDAYKILSKKHPEKAFFYAQQILNIQKLI